MKLLGIKISNYKNILEAEIDFTQGNIAPERNVILIGGMNGAGKTTIKEVIERGLYSEKKEKMYRCINRRNRRLGKGCEIELHLDNGEEIIIRRRFILPPTSNSPDDLIEELTVIRNGKEEPHPESMWTEYTDLHIPRGITQFFIFDGEKLQELLADDEKAEKKLRSSFEAALGIDLSKKLEMDISGIRREEENRRRDGVNNKSIEWRQMQIEAMEQERDELILRKGEIEEGMEDLQQKIAFCEDEFEMLAGFDFRALQNKEERQREELSIRNQLTQLEKETGDFIRDNLSLAYVAKLFPPLIQQMEVEADANRSSNILGLAADLAQTIVREVEIPHTPCCERSFTDWERQLLHGRILEAIQNFGTANHITPILQLSDTQTTRIRLRIEELAQNWWSTRLDQKFSQQTELLNRLNLLQQELDRTRIRPEIRFTCKELLEEHDNYLIQFGALKEARGHVQDQILDVERRIQEARVELEDVYRQYDDSVEREQFLKQINCLQGLLQEYRETVCDLKINELENHTLHMYKKLARKPDMVSHVSIHPRSFVTTIYDPDRNIIDKEEMSAGEKLIYTISLLWGLGQTSQLNIPIVIDTPLSRLDTYHRRNMIERYYPNAGEQVIILSTDTEVSSGYFEKLEPFLQQTVMLSDSNNGHTEISDGYFQMEA